MASQILQAARAGLLSSLNWTSNLSMDLFRLSLLFSFCVENKKSRLPDPGSGPGRSQTRNDDERRSETVFVFGVFPPATLLMAVLWRKQWVRQRSTTRHKASSIGEKTV
jgi:hypothetical protein